jgi:hypothetical protein
MKEAKFIYCIALMCVLSNCIYSQTDTLVEHKVSFLEFNLGFGGGICTRGGIVGYSNTLVFSNDWGAGMSIKSNLFKTEKLPDDFHKSNTWNITPPLDYVHVLSLTLIKKFPTSSKKIKIGIEGGPSAVRYNFAYFKLNPNYPGPNGFENKYNKYRSKKTAIGFSCRVKTEFITRFGGLEMALFTDMNELKSVLGLEFYINFAIVRRD